MLSFRRTPPGIIAGEVIETPLELARTPDRWRQLFGSPLPLENVSIARYERREISPGVMLFSAAQQASTLIVGFSGRWLRLMLPVAAILQHLDESRFDLLLLADDTRGHYRNGIGAFANSFHPLCVGIERLRISLGYHHLITLGASMGGLPALRAGALLDANRAVALGARFAWDISRVRNAKRRADAFDPLCACRDTRVPAYALHSENISDDIAHAQKLSSVMPHCKIVPVPVPDHNILYPLLRNGQLGIVLRELFNLEQPVDKTVLSAAFGKRNDMDFAPTAKWS